MRIKDVFDDKEAIFYRIELNEDIFVDVKRIGNLYYVMDCEDGYRSFNSDGNSFDYYFNEEDVISFVKRMTT